ncbi:helix-turn-helix domain-containing protein [Mucilaginibacter terrae]|uniref:AraC family transcriptional regulator of adaptative response / methylphosphotriester-DNA alkyltransferase methyltransferase n=1 Tax=Mucilaginibacter terrae TaxID=1955052 RepID=A0ABU3GPU7_9SPHI|nr:helix-turn-helix domain-containing protein [Mucilaginibacter terrae]MDT3401650.1 AraC family transcriptional regulator of adaptative response / methylphosphotriester-DNA alkyltransferase methyltransferase [Mucilaginibacter terrae]
MPIPQKLLTRKDEITRDFLRLYEDHINKLMSGEHNKRYSAKTFANLLFIDSRHLTNTLKLTTGRSPCDFMEERIIDEAKKLLAQTNLSVAQIGYKFAYEDPTNFTKFFKIMTGITPLQYRKKLQTAA